MEFYMDLDPYSFFGSVQKNVYLGNYRANTTRKVEECFTSRTLIRTFALSS